MEWERENSEILGGRGGGRRRREGGKKKKKSKRYLPRDGSKNDFFMRRNVKRYREAIEPVKKEAERKRKKKENKKKIFFKKNTHTQRIVLGFVPVCLFLCVPFVCFSCPAAGRSPASGKEQQVTSTHSKHSTHKATQGKLSQTSMKRHLRTPSLNHTSLSAPVSPFNPFFFGDNRNKGENRISVREKNENARETRNKDHPKRHANHHRFTQPRLSALTLSQKRQALCRCAKSISTSDVSLILRCLARPGRLGHGANQPASHAQCSLLQSTTSLGVVGL